MPKTKQTSARRTVRSKKSEKTTVAALTPPPVQSHRWIALKHRWFSGSRQATQSGLWWQQMSSLPLQFLLLTVAGWMTRDQRVVTEYLLAENEVLRQQLRGRRIRYTDAQRRRLALAAMRVGRRALSRIDTLVTPDTLLRWYRRLVAKKYDSSDRGRSRPRRTADIAELVLRMARDNSGWGYTRIRGALSNLGHDIGRNTIKRILAEAGLDPAPERSKRSSWSSFLRAHWGAIAAMDFFTVEVVSLVGLVRYHVLFVIDLASRRSEVTGIVHRPHEAWMKQAARNLTDRVLSHFLIERHAAARS